jgi:hypothetical protein
MCLKAPYNLHVFCMVYIQQYLSAKYTKENSSKQFKAPIITISLVTLFFFLNPKLTKETLYIWVYFLQGYYNPCFYTDSVDKHLSVDMFLIMFVYKLVIGLS